MLTLLNRLLQHTKVYRTSDFGPSPTFLIDYTIGILLITPYNLVFPHDD